METRADYVLIGTFTISIIAGVFLFVLWLAQVEVNREWAEYDIFFESQITGLSESGDVRFSGIKVGEVKRLSIDPENPDRVIARIRIDDTTPVTNMTVATLEFQGLTGVAYILLESGGKKGNDLEIAEGRDVPFIVAEASAFQELFEGAPDVLSGANKLLARAENMLGDENQAYVTGILADLNTVSSSVADRSEDIEEVIANLKIMSEELASVSTQFNTMSENLSTLSVNANDILERDGARLASEAADAVSEMKSLATNANAIVEDNAAAIRSFSDGGLAQFGLFVVEARQLVRSLDRVLERMESDPARYISGNDAAEYEAAE